jgi:hypothetical protein
LGAPVPAISGDSSITAATFTDFEDASYGGLAVQLGAKQLPSGVALAGVQPLVDGAGRCDLAAPLNLGEPYRPPGASAVAACVGYAPVGHGTGPRTTFAIGARGQGVLLIDGDLEIQGNFEWSGVIVVRGSLLVSGTGNRIYGAVLVEAGPLGAGSIDGDLELWYSECAVRQALTGAATIRPLRARSWAQLY